MTSVRRVIAASALIGMAGFLGCSDDSLGTRYPVSGTVTYKGKPLEKGTITFMPPSPEARGASGEIVDGEYSLMTHTPGDGAFPGTYKVVVVSREEADPQKVQAAQQKLAAKAGLSGVQSPDPAMISKVRQTAKSRIPEKYAAPTTSNLTAEVKAQSNTIPFTLED